MPCKNCPIPLTCGKYASCTYEALRATASEPGNPNAVEPSLMPSGYVPVPFECPRMGHKVFTPDLASDHAPLWSSYPEGRP